MKRLISSIGLVLAFSVMPAGCKEHYQGTQPRVTVHYHSTGDSRGFLEWDSPVFASYADGTVIWRKGWRPSLAALAVTDIQHAEEMEEKVESMMARYSGKTFTLTGSSDPEMTTVRLKGKTLTILGDWRKPRVVHAETADEPNRVAETNEREQKLWSTLPSEVREALSELEGFDVADSRPWRPERLVLLLQPPIKTRNPSIAWPAGWPQSFVPVPGSRTMKWIELPGMMLEEVLKTFPDDGQPPIISVGGETRYAELRLVFPGEGADPKGSGCRF